jgi:tRNA G10  N-methylase Trm11
MIICILGRQPAIGLAELESRFGSDKVLPVGESAASVDVDIDDVPAHLLGSVAVPLEILPDTDWNKVMTFAKEYTTSLAETLPEGKFKLGLSVYDLPVNIKTLQRSGLELKKTIRAAGRSVRIIPNTALELNSAQILHNQLTGDLGCELLLIRHGNRTQIARTAYVQDIDDYARRDFGRPKRDAFVGMLPPKLAQTMLNLAQVRPGQVTLDPFCGTGVVLQEAALMGSNLYGTDVNERMVRYTRDNLAWLKDIYPIEFEAFFEVADATTATWRQPIDSVVCEGYLGQPLTTFPDPGKLDSIRAECNTIAEKFLRNLHSQLKIGTRCCIAVPAWFNGKGYIHLDIVDDLEKMGYNRLSFSGATQSQLIYHRSDQIVARELLVLKVKEL